MSRRDTIIIAVLLNAGLLIVLFTTSLKSDKASDEPPAITTIASSDPAPKELSQMASIPQTSTSPDHVDQVIQQYVTPQVATGIDSNPNFLADLHAIAPTQESVSPQPTPVEMSFKQVTVKKGDVLERIARQNHVAVSEIMKLNNLTTTRLRIGQVLKIPAKGTTVAPMSSSGEAQYYTIKAGDNPWTIAVKHKMKVEELLKLNNMDESKARRLKAGDKIRIK
jgi:peptidoglycan endopeptidase LytF